MSRQKRHKNYYYRAKALLVDENGPKCSCKRFLRLSRPRCGHNCLKYSNLLSRLCSRLRGSMTFAHTIFALRHLPRDICLYDVCPEGHLPRRTLPRKTFAQKDICPYDICPEDICPERHLPRKTFAQKTFAQKDVCPERHLPKKTFDQKTFAQ
jgi:hypothetical protein